MATITEILAEAFNRVKTEHGVTLSRVTFEHYSGNLQGVTFTSSGSVYQNVGPMPPQLQPVAVSPGSPPEDATHFGSLHDGPGIYWKYDQGALYWYGDVHSLWYVYDPDSATAEQVVAGLIALEGSPPYRP